MSEAILYLFYSLLSIKVKYWIWLFLCISSLSCPSSRAQWSVPYFLDLHASYCGLTETRNCPLICRWFRILELSGSPLIKNLYFYVSAFSIHLGIVYSEKFLSRALCTTATVEVGSGTEIIIQAHIIERNTKTQQNYEVQPTCHISRLNWWRFFHSPWSQMHKCKTSHSQTKSNKNVFPFKLLK